MRRRLLTCVVVFCASALWAAEGDWQVGRIVDIQKDVKTDTLYWVANTPVTSEETTYKIAVHLKDKIFTGTYKIDRSQPPLPNEWVKNEPVKMQIEGNQMLLKAKSGDEFRIAISHRRSAATLEPIPADEVDEAYGVPSKVKRDSPIGFSTPKPEGETTPGSADAGATPQTSDGEQTGGGAEPEQPATGTLSVTTAPYLADVYIDGKNAGYSPTKVTLSAGKHTVRFEKAGYKSWSKEVEIAGNSEVTVDATLEKSPGKK